MRVLLKTVVSAAAAVLLSLCFAVTSRSQSMPGYQAPAKPKDQTPVSAKAARGEAPLSKLYDKLKADTSKTIHLRPLTEREKRQKPGKFLQIGVVRSLPRPLNPLVDSAFYTVPEGDVRVSSVVDEAALYTRVQFSRMSLPAGARVFVYSASNQDEYYGPYEGLGESTDGTFWTPPIHGDSVIIEYFTPAGTNSTNSPFKVFAIAHIYKDLTAPNDPAAACENEVTSDWLNVAKSVGRVDFISGPFAGSCTGTLLNDQANDQEPYFLTAHHCISTQTEAQSVTVYWNYNTGDSPPPGTPQTNGAGLLVTGTASDFTLLRLNKNQMPGGLFFSGWDATNFAGTAAATGIHHPQASHKRISFGTAVQPNPGDCDPDEQCLRVNWSSGVTEDGSSGSGIWTGSPSDSGGPKLVGNLTGGPSACDEVPANMWDGYGRFSVTYPVIAGYLTGSCVSFVNPLSQNFPGSGGNGSFSVTAVGGCNWIAGSTDSFVTTTSTGTGSGTVNFSVAANPNGLPRTATIFVGVQTFTINQAGSSSGSCAPAPINFGQTINGALTVNSCPLGDGSVLDAYSFSATAGQQVSISMTSPDFDTYLFLINPNGTILTFDDDGGGGSNSRIPPGSGTFITLPATGTYTILANAFWPANHTPEPGVGSYSLTLTERPTQTLSLASSNPDSGITVTYTPNDRSGNSSANTPVTRTFYQNQSVNLNLSSVTAPNGNLFRKWQLDGVDYSTISAISVNTNVSHTATAVFGPPQDLVLTVNSSNPGSGVDITVGPADKNGQAGGPTPFTRTYVEAAPNTMVSLTAPNTASGGNVFQKWQKDGVDYDTGPSTIVFMNAAHTMTAVYVSPLTFALTVNSSNPSSGINITVSPNDNNGSGDGVAPFTRTYSQATHVFLTAPAAAPNGNVFDRWVKPNGDTGSFSRSFDFFMAANTTFTAVYATKPFVWLETGTTNALAINSVTFLRGPFQILDPHNFSTDGHTRIILFTSDLGLTQADLSDPAVLVVTAQTLTLPVQGWTLPVEAVGPYSGGSGLTGSYIVVKLPDGLPTQQLELRVRLRQTTSDASFITIAP